MRLWGFGLSEAAPAGRRKLAWVYLAGAMVAGYGSTVLDVAPAVTAGVVALVHLAWAAQMWRLAAVPLYLRGGVPLVSQCWSVVAGERVGPFALGPPDAEAVELLRTAHAVYRINEGEAAYLFRHVSGWTAVIVRTRAPVDPAAPPPAEEALTITAVQTSCPLHATKQDVRPGRTLPEAIGALGLPDGIDQRVGLARLRYPGLVVGARRKRVQWLLVSAAGR
ncbi:MAG: hypothetical protein K6W08_14875 [Firmicutes bacterium]|nr:hypothetical protein [Bacillota bacterium]